MGSTLTMRPAVRARVGPPGPGCPETRGFWRASSRRATGRRQLWPPRQSAPASRAPVSRAAIRDMRSGMVGLSLHCDAPDIPAVGVRQRSSWLLLQDILPSRAYRHGSPAVPSGCRAGLALHATAPDNDPYRVWPIIGLQDKGPQNVRDHCARPATPPANWPTARNRAGRARTGRAHHRHGGRGRHAGRRRRRRRCGARRARTVRRMVGQYAPGLRSRVGRLVRVGRRRTMRPRCQPWRATCGPTSSNGPTPAARWARFEPTRPVSPPCIAPPAMAWPVRAARRGIRHARQAGKVGTARARAAPG